MNLYSRPIPASAGNSVINAQERTRRDRARDANNAARWAISEHQISTRGVGNLRVTTPVRFDVAFLEEPQFTSGVALIRHPSPTAWYDPSGSSLVRSWLRDEAGNYTGASMSYRVEIDPNTAAPTDAPPNVELVHFLCFTGLAYKAIAGQVTDMTPLPVRF